MSGIVSTDGIKGLWKEAAPALMPPVAAGLSIIPVFRDMIAKSFAQRGVKVPHIKVWPGLVEGLRAAPVVGAIVGTQMSAQGAVEKQFGTGLGAALASSSIVGAISAPILAIFNGQTMGWTMHESWKRLSGRQVAAIAVQEAAFVGGLSAVDKVAFKEQGKGAEYFAAFAGGALGSLVGHPANTALTRWQSGLKVESVRQLMWGAGYKARAVGAFAVLYKAAKEAAVS